MTWEATGTASSVLCPAIWASTEVATASAAERALSPLGAAEAELCWMTGAGEPVGSELSFGLSAPGNGREEKRVRDSSGCGVAAGGGVGTLLVWGGMILI